MSNTWKELDAEQKREAPPSTCRYCGEPIYWEALPSGKKQPVNATVFERHDCGKRREESLPTEKKRGVPAPSKETEMPTDKGKCPHGEFILLDGCPQCIAERHQRDEVAEVPVNHASNDASSSTPYSTSYHAPYRLADGSTAPSVTTVLNGLDKGEGMQYWAWDLGRQGLDYREVRDAAGRVGTLAHHLIACHLKGETPLSGGYPPEEVEKAKKCFAKYLAWEKQNPISPVMIEERLVSEEYRYGGTPDLLAELNGEFVLIDFKTGGGIYKSYYHQVAAYRKLLEEQDWPVASARILRISPDDDQYEVGIQLDFDCDWQTFQHALGIWQLNNGGR